jgi:wyosine [tRNA(Phe)-imidazoG37] synthetase (radical SAM superfamily)
LITKPSKYRYLFGPVSSRRLKLSLGIDPVPFKTCSLDCVYCELGKTADKIIKRQSFAEPKEIIGELIQFLRTGNRPDCITVSGSGEPTLNLDLEEIIQEVKKITSIPLAVITNSTLLSDPKVRSALLPADIVLPSLDAVTPKAFHRVNRPHSSLEVDRIITGLHQLREEFSGEIWLEVLLVRGINDQPEEMELLREETISLRPDRIQLNTVARPGTEDSALPLADEHLQKLKDFFGPPAEVIAGSRHSSAKVQSGPVEERILETASRRPVTAEEIAAGMGLEIKEAEKFLTRLTGSGGLKILQHEGKKFWIADKYQGDK